MGTRTITVTKTLSQLLEEVDVLFVHESRKPRLAPHDFSLSKFPYGWSFDVTNSWQNWGHAGWETQFGAWSSPEAAVQEFLDYVKANKINVAELMDAD